MVIFEALVLGFILHCFSDGVRKANTSNSIIGHVLEGALLLSCILSGACAVYLLAKDVVEAIL